MNELIVIEKKIKNMIYEIRGEQVMLDYDLAKLYECKNGTKEINQAVKNNPIKFPERYCWVLTDDESKEFLVKNFDQKIETRGGRFKNQRVFTESGVAMLATILHTKVATEISIKIMDAFVSMRHYLVDNKDIYKSINNINNKLIEHDKKFNYFFSKFDKKEQLFLKGQTFSAYSNILDILKNAKDNIIIVDEYADISFLNLIKNIQCDIVLITKDSKRLSDLDIEIYNKEYDNLKVIRNNSFHDRYFIIDNKEFYHCGTSINRIGYKTFSITRMNDEKTYIELLNKVQKIINKKEEQYA